MHLEEVFHCGLAGTCVFSFTDEWFTGGHPISDWAFGLVTRERKPKQAFARGRRGLRRRPAAEAGALPEGLGGGLLLQRRQDAGRLPARR